MTFTQSENPGYAIIHTFPNGQRLGAGYVTAGIRPQIARYAYWSEAEASANKMREHLGQHGHQFEIVPYPTN